MPQQQATSVAKPRIFIGSSTPNLSVARAIADCLGSRNFKPLVWDEGLIKQNESTFDGLLRISTEIDFGVFVWGANDVAMASGESIVVPRDNVVFETGLFLGALGRDRTFMIVDQSIEIKIPSDFAGITRAHYDGSSMGADDLSAVSSACNIIERSIRQRQVPSFLFRLQGQWKSRFAAGPVAHHPVTTDDVEIAVAANGISLTGSSGQIPYSGEGRVYHENQIIGQWTHPLNRSMAKGLFMLIVSPTADAMYGYSTSQDASGAAIFGTWVFAKNNGDDEQVINAILMRAQEFLKGHTISPRFARNK